MKKLFIIDDDKVITSLYADYFAARGYIVASSNTPFGVTTGIKMLDPDVLIVDMNLPMMSGHDMLSIIDYKGSYKIVLISGELQEDEMKTLKANGQADDYFIKGEPLDTLVHKVNSLVRLNTPAAVM